MTYDFETLSPAPAHHFWNSLRELGLDAPEAISYGVAEMKFPLAPEIKAGLHACADTGYFGYYGDPDYAGVVCDYYASRHGWAPERDWLVQTYGVVTAFAMAIRCFTAPGDGIIIQTPVYTPFFNEIESNGRRVLENRLVRNESRYEMDFEGLERLAALPESKMLILCSPHNPVGRVWSRRELQRLSEICLRHGVLVVSDEIHNDLVFDGSHSIYASLSPEAAQNCVVCTAPSKTFNIPGLITSNIFIPNAELREKYQAELARCIGHYMSITGPAAGTAAYQNALPWLDELLVYLKENAELFYSLVREKLPQAWTPKMEGTYLAWLDLSFLGLDDETLEAFLRDKAKLLVNMGRSYGKAGSGFIRINIGCPRRYVIDAVERLAAAINQL